MAWTKDQELAINEYSKNIIVSAGAGSGKTAVLSERVLTHIKRGIHVDELLVLTFTNAAALEMKERIRKKLLDNNFIDEANKLDTAYITTFDSLALSLLKKYSYKKNLSKNINVIDSTIISLKKEELLESIFEKYYESNNELFLNLIKDFCLKDDREIFDSIIKLNDSLDNVFNKRELLENYIDNYYNIDNINNLINKYNDLLFDKINNIKELLDTIKYYLEDKNYKKIYDNYSSLINSNNYLDIKFNVNNLGVVRLTNASDESKLIREKIKSIIEYLKVLTKYNDIDDIKQSIYSTKDYIDIIIKIILEFDQKINDFKYNISSFEFSDISKMAISIIKENEDIKKELKYKYKEILIDEYQDTNDLQDIFISLIENHNCYMVGDIKQSIYRFRNANPSLFKKKYKLYDEDVNDLKIDLKNNFRSRENVILNINLIFNLIMDENIGGAAYFDSHQMEFGQTKYLDVNEENYDMEFLNYKIDDDYKKYSEEEIEIFTIAKDILNKVNNKYTIMDKDTFIKREITYSDFAILIDRSKSFELYKRVFEYLGIPITIRKNSKINSSIDINIIKNIFNLLILIKNKDYSKSFKYSYMSIARSYLFEIEDNKILDTLTNNSYYESDIYVKCIDIVNNIDNLSISEIYDLIIDKFDIYNKLIKVGDVNNHLVILDYISKIIHDLESLGYTYIDFYNYLENILDKNLDIELSLNKGSENSVKIMTIHTSKGLEFPVVYFPGLSKKFNTSDIKDKFIYNNKYGFISLYKDRDVLKNNIVFYLLKDSYMKEEISEKLRLFYVALTRAREKMIFVGSFEENILSNKVDNVINANVRYSYNSFKDIINSIYKYIKKYIYNINLDELNLTKEYNYIKVTDLNINKGNEIIVSEKNIESNKIEQKRLSKNTHQLYTKDIKQNINLGLKMHEVFELTDFNNVDASNLSEVELNLLNKFISNIDLTNIKNVYKELEFVMEEDNQLIHGIIDLVLVYPDKNVIIDYKLKNTSDDAYIKQLNGYKKYIEGITNKKTDIYLYSIVDNILNKIDEHTL